MAISLNKKGATVLHSLKKICISSGSHQFIFYTLPGWVYPAIAPISNIINKKNAICAIPTTNTVDSLFFLITICFIEKRCWRDDSLRKGMDNYVWQIIFLVSILNEQRVLKVNIIFTTPFRTKKSLNCAPPDSWYIPTSQQ